MSGRIVSHRWISVGQAEPLWLVATPTAASYADMHAQLTVSRWGWADAASSVGPGMRRLVDQAVRHVPAGALLEVALALAGDSAEFTAAVTFFGCGVDPARQLGTGLWWSRRSDGLIGLCLTIRVPVRDAEADTTELWQMGRPPWRP